MPSNSDAETTIRLYLWSELDAAARDEFEKRLLTDDDLFQELLALEDELMDEYLAGRWSADEIEMFERKFLATPERQRKLRFARALRKYATSHAPAEPLATAISEPQPTVPPTSQPWNWRHLSSNPYLRAAAFAAVVVIAALGVWRIFFFQSEVDKGLVALKEAFRQQRPLEGRISEFDYAPFVVTRGPDVNAANVSELRRAEITLLESVSTNPTPAARHALGKVYLAKKEFDQAIGKFEEALKGAPGSTEIYADLGAAYLERSRINASSDPNDPNSSKRIQDLARSLGALNRALELNPNLREARFNRALLYQEMLLSRQAEDDWKKYLEQDGNSPWANEARRYLKRLQERTQDIPKTKEELLSAFLNAYESNNSERAWEIIRHSRESFSAGKLIRDQLLDKYLRTESDKGNSQATLEALRFLGRLEVEKTGDVYSAELSRFYQHASQSQRETLQQARGLMKTGQERYASAKPLEAAEFFNQSKQLFAQVGDHWESQYAELWTGYCYLNASQTERSVSVLKALVPLFEQQKHKWLQMRALHILSGAEYNLSEYSRGIDYNQQSLALANQMGDAVGTFNTQTILIEQYRHIGNFERALAYIQPSLSLIDSCSLNEVQIAQYYGILASTLSSAGFYPAAAAYQKEAVRRASTTDQIQTISRAYASLGLIYGKMGDYGEALTNASLAYNTAKSHSDESIKQGMMAYTSLQLGDLYRESGDIPKAIERYDESLELYKRLNNYYGLYEAHKNRLLCYIVQKNDSAAKKELETTLGLITKYRSQIREGDNRNHFFDLEQNVYDLAIDFEYSRMNNSAQAFANSEESRSRALLDLVKSTATISTDKNHPDLLYGPLVRTLRLDEIQARLPEHAQILQYAILRDKVLIWVISKDTFATVESRIDQKQLTDQISRYVQALSQVSNSQTDFADAKQLFEVLIKPAQPFLENDSAIHIVPDKALNYLPFGALVSPDTNRFLVEDYLTVVSPSASLLIYASELARTKEGKVEERLLSVGDPAFDQAEYPTLAQLPSAATEAEKVATYYASNCLLTRHDAVKPRVELEMHRADIIHLAVHSVFDQRTPLRSKLLLTKPRSSPTSEASSGVLQASEIYKLKLPQARMVVLSACQSGVEQYFGGEGMISLAQPFLAARVPLVVASFWPVDSDTTAELMISFHKHRRLDKLSSARALRRTQLEMLRSSDERLRQPNCWAAFTAIGGWTSF